MEHLNQIVLECKAGKQEGFARLFDLYAGRLYGYFYRLTSNKETSEDLVSELFLKIVERIKSFKDGNFEAWLFKIASNGFYDYLRSKQRQEKALDAKKEDVQAALKNEKDNLMIDRLQRELGRLDEATREMIVLRFYSQLGFREIAEIRGEPIGTVLSKVHRGLAKLRGLMEKNE